jgi:hypothetical protein
MEKGAIKSIKEMIPNDHTAREEILNKIHSSLVTEAND